jgi:hypothetical protein
MQMDEDHYSVNAKDWPSGTYVIELQSADGDFYKVDQVVLAQ